MGENPYSPPGAEVRDVDRGPPPMERPRAVVLAVRLLWISIVAGIPISVREYHDASAEGSATFLLYFTLALYAISVWMVVSIRKGRNWARILLLAFNVLNLLSIALAYEEFRKYPTGELLALMIVVALDFTALCLLYTRAGAAWFRRGRSSA
jgi:hypothetical protein